MTKKEKECFFYWDGGEWDGGKFIYLESSHQPVSSVPVAVDVSCLLPMLVVALRGSREMVAVFAFFDKSWHVARAPSWLEAVTAPIVDVVITYPKQKKVEAVFCFFYAILQVATTWCPKKVADDFGRLVSLTTLGHSGCLGSFGPIWAILDHFSQKSGPPALPLKFCYSIFFGTPCRSSLQASSKIYLFAVCLLVLWWSDACKPMNVCLLILWSWSEVCKPMNGVPSRVSISAKPIDIQSKALESIDRQQSKYLFDPNAKLLLMVIIK